MLFLIPHLVCFKRTYYLPKNHLKRYYLPQKSAKNILVGQREQGPLLPTHADAHVSCNPGVNFINGFCALFKYECHFGSFFSTYVRKKSCRNNICTKKAREKRWWNWRQHSFYFFRPGSSNRSGMRSASPASNEDLAELHSQYVHVEVSSPSDDQQFIVYTEWSEKMNLIQKATKM